MDQATINKQIVTDLLSTAKYKINVEDLVVKIATSRNIKQEDIVSIILALFGCANMVPVKETTDAGERENSDTTNQDKE